MENGRKKVLFTPPKQIGRPKPITIETRELEVHVKDYKTFCLSRDDKHHIGSVIIQLL